MGYILVISYTTIATDESRIYEGIKLRKRLHEQGGGQMQARTRVCVASTRARNSAESVESTRARKHSENVLLACAIPNLQSHNAIVQVHRF